LGVMITEISRLHTSILQLLQNWGDKDSWLAMAYAHDVSLFKHCI
jgi:hypothetical protein